MPKTKPTDKSRTSKNLQSNKLKDAAYYINGIIEQNTSILAQAITILESSSEKHYQLGQDILNAVIKKSGDSIRIAITGAPGAGKSTFIDSFGTMLTDMGYRVAVLAVDPSSSLTKGAILGDKTRMEKLSRDKKSFIRPSPSGDKLGGVAGKTRESILACEAAGFDIIIVETVGVGQSEISVRSMVDFFLLLLLPGEGDELQGIKKGTVELADAIIINKADGDNKINAELTKQQYEQSVHYLRPVSKGWKPIVKTVSSLNNKGLDSVWSLISEFVDKMKSSGFFYERREKQLIEWFHSSLKDMLLKQLLEDKQINIKIAEMEKSVVDGELSVTEASKELINKYVKK